VVSGGGLMKVGKKHNFVSASKLKRNSMKSDLSRSMKILIVCSVIVVIMATTNPSFNDCEQEITVALRSRIKTELAISDEVFASKIPLLRQTLERNNFLIFSTIRSNANPRNRRTLAIGVLGQVFVFLD
jgi:hypothetical protein